MTLVNMSAFLSTFEADSIQQEKEVINEMKARMMKIKLKF